MNQESKKVIKMLFHLGLPIILQSILTTLLPMADQIMVGQLGADAISAIAVSGRLFNIFFFIVLALGGVTSIYIAQFWGSQDIDKIPQTLKIPLITGGIALAALLIVAFAFPQASVKLFIDNDRVAEMAAEFQKVYAISALPLLLTNLYSALLRSITKVKVPMVTGITSIVLNTGLNYLLMFVIGMGAWGAVWATLIARTVECAMLFVYIHFIDKTVRFNLFTVLFGKLDSDFRKKFLVSMAPLVLNNLCFIFADTIYTRLYGMMSEADVAAHSIMLPVQAFAIGLFSGIAAATAIILGTMLGSDEIDEAISASKIILRFVLIATLITSALVALFSMLYINFFKVDEDVKHRALLLLFAACAFLTVKVMNMVICQGVIESGGETRFILINNIIGPICIGIPLALLSFYVLHLPIYWMYSVVTMEEVVRLIICFIKYRKNDWARNITKKSEALEVS